jgi:hypothetical protein
VAGNIVDDEIELSARPGAGAPWIDATFEEAADARFRHQAEHGTVGEVELRHADSIKRRWPFEDGGIEATADLLIANVQHQVSTLNVHNTQSTSAEAAAALVETKTVGGRRYELASVADWPPLQRRYRFAMAESGVSKARSPASGEGLSECSVCGNDDTRVP